VAELRIKLIVKPEISKVFKSLLNIVGHNCFLPWEEEEKVQAFFDSIEIVYKEDKRCLIMQLKE